MLRTAGLALCSLQEAPSGSRIVCFFSMLCEDIGSGLEFCGGVFTYISLAWGGRNGVLWAICAVWGDSRMSMWSTSNLNVHLGKG